MIKLFEKFKKKKDYEVINIKNTFDLDTICKSIEKSLKIFSPCEILENNFGIDGNQIQNMVSIYFNFDIEKDIKMISDIVTVFSDSILIMKEEENWFHIEVLTDLEYLSTMKLDYDIMHRIEYSGLETIINKIMYYIPTKYFIQPEKDFCEDLNKVTKIKIGERYKISSDISLSYDILNKNQLFQYSNFYDRKFIIDDDCYLLRTKNKNYLENRDPDSLSYFNDNEIEDSNNRVLSVEELIEKYPNEIE